MKTPMMITGRMVLLGLFTFFGVVFAVNGALVYFAMDSWPGLSTENAYEQGRDYNQTLADEAAQSSLGWTSDITLSKNMDGHVMRVVFTDANGTPLDGLQVRATFSRPVGAENIVNITLPETAIGEYSSPVTLPLAGRWHAFVEAGTGETVRYHMRYEVTVTP